MHLEKAGIVFRIHFINEYVCKGPSLGEFRASTRTSAPKIGILHGLNEFAVIVQFDRRAGSAGVAIDREHHFGFVYRVPELTAVKSQAAGLGWLGQPGERLSDSQ